MAIKAELKLKMVEIPYRNENFYGNVRHSVETTETYEYDKFDNLELPPFKELELVFADGEYSYDVKIDAHIFENLDGDFKATFTNQDGNLFEVIFMGESNAIYINKFHSLYDYDDGEEFETIDDFHEKFVK